MRGCTAKGKGANTRSEGSESVRLPETHELFLIDVAAVVFVHQAEEHLQLFRMQPHPELHTQNYQSAKRSAKDHGTMALTRIANAALVTRSCAGAQTNLEQPNRELFPVNTAAAISVQHFEALPNNSWSLLAPDSEPPYGSSTAASADDSNGWWNTYGFCGWKAFLHFPLDFAALGRLHPSCACRLFDIRGERIWVQLLCRQSNGLDGSLLSAVEGHVLSPPRDFHYPPASHTAPVRTQCQDDLTYPRVPRCMLEMKSEHSLRKTELERHARSRSLKVDALQRLIHAVLARL